MASPLSKARPVVAEFSRRVRAMRLAAKITQVELAERAHVREQFISLIERGRANPSLVTIALIASALGCGVSDMFAPDTAAEEAEHTRSVTSPDQR